MPKFKNAGWCFGMLLAFCGLARTPARADIAESQVLVVYNAASADGVALKNAYLAAHPGIPAANVVELNNAALATVAELTQAQFITNVRDPIRAHLLAAGPPAPADIVAIVLIRPMPHRIWDSDNIAVGDTSAAGNEIGAGDATYASLDSELVLLWQDLYTGEAGGRMDSRSDNVIDNPYHQSTAGIHTFSRAAIQTAKTFNNVQNFYWALGGSGSTRLTPGDMYLVCRIDGTTQAQAMALIERAQDLAVNRAAVKIILDEYDTSVAEDLDDDNVFSPPSSDPFWAGNDYEETTALLMANGWDVRYDDTANFITGSEERAPLIAYASYGENHSLFGAGENPPGNGTYIEAFRFAPGAIFNTLESYNGRALNGLGTLHNQEQVADFVAAGGTFGIGHVFEPFTFSVPDNEFLFVNMLVRQMRWAEAAYTSLPVLSWQHVVLGDPLGRYEAIVEFLGDCNADAAVDLDDYVEFGPCIGGPASPVAAGCACADIDGDGDSDLRDIAAFQREFGRSAF